MIQPACQQRLAFTKKSLCEKYRGNSEQKTPLNSDIKKRQYLGHWTPNISEIVRAIKYLFQDSKFNWGIQWKKPPTLGSIWLFILEITRARSICLENAGKIFHKESEEICVNFCSLLNIFLFNQHECHSLAWSYMI